MYTQGTAQYVPVGVDINSTTTGILDKPISTVERACRHFHIAESGCWQWDVLNEAGYGTFAGRGAHRVIYELVRGRLTDGLVLDHLCRNRGCVNPFHLEEVTQHINTMRGLAPTAINAKKVYCDSGHPLFGRNLIMKITKSNGHLQRFCRACLSRVRSVEYRRAKGLPIYTMPPSVRKRRLKEEDVRDIYMYLENGIRTYDIAIVYGMTQQGVYKIKHGLSWPKLYARYISEKSLHSTNNSLEEK